MQFRSSTLRFFLAGLDGVGEIGGDISISSASASTSRCPLLERRTSVREQFRVSRLTLHFCEQGDEHYFINVFERSFADLGTAFSFAEAV